MDLRGAVVFVYRICPGGPDSFVRSAVPAAVAHLNAISGAGNHPFESLPSACRCTNQAGMERLLQQISDPASPNYRHYLTPAQFSEQFGPSVEDYQRVLDFARTNGLTVIATYSNRMVLNVSGEVPDIEKAFRVTMQVYQHPTESRTFYSCNVEPNGGCQRVDIESAGNE